MLSQVEDFWLRWHVAHDSDELAGRARLVLETEHGSAPGQVAARLGLSTVKFIAATAALPLIPG